jgi:transposase
MPERTLPSVDHIESAARAGCLFPERDHERKTMPKKYILKTPKAPAKGGAMETYLAPAPPTNGRIIGLDCHPDTFTAAVFVGQTPHDARKVGSRENLSLEAMLQWASDELTPQDIIMMEAGSNSFEVCKRLSQRGLRACVLESVHVGKHAKTYADNDKMAAARIALVYLAGNAPCVWVPDEKSRENRELLHAYRAAVNAHTAATNSLKGFLNGRGIRIGKRTMESPKTQPWILEQGEWTEMQAQLLNEHFEHIAESKKRRTRLYQVISKQVANDPRMIICMKVLGVGIINAFALMAVIGDVHRFASPEKLVAYIGLNPGQQQSGKTKNIRLGVGRRGRGDIRNLLVQGAQAVLGKGRNTTLGKWGWRLFARKGNRNVAVAAVARKLLVQVWHVLKGNPPDAQETAKSFQAKLQKLLVQLGAKLRKEMGLDGSLTEAVAKLLERAASTPVRQPT